MGKNSKTLTLLNEAWRQRRLGNYEKAKGLVDEAQSLCSDNDFNALGRVFHIRAQFESDHNKPQEALSLSSRALSYYKKAKNRDKIAHATRHIADLQSTLGMVAESETHYREALAIYQEHEQTDPCDLANAWAGMARLLERRGKLDQATAAWKEAKASYQACDLTAGIKEADQRIATLAGD